MNKKKTVEFVEIEKDSLDFLYAVCFGNYEKQYTAASSRAYRDFNRTIKFKKENDDPIDDSIRKRLREETTESIREFIIEANKLEEKGMLSQDKFDEKHHDLSDRIIKKYRNESIDFTYGQAQKWINMTLKYLYVLDKKKIQSILQYCHVPIDKYILKYAKEMLDIKQEKEEPWSKWDNYDKYLKYQKSLREKIKGECPLRWEFKAWMNAAGKY